MIDVLRDEPRTALVLRKAIKDIVSVGSSALGMPDLPPVGQHWPKADEGYVNCYTQVTRRSTGKILFR